MNDPVLSDLPLRFDPGGIPILDEVVEDRFFEELAADLKRQLLIDLEPMLQELVQAAFGASVRRVALELKHSFEQELSQALEQRLHALVEESVERACRSRA